MDTVAQCHQVEEEEDEEEILEGKNNGLLW